MHQDAHARIDELQHTLDLLSRRVQELAQRVTQLEPGAAADAQQPSSPLTTLIEQKRAAKTTAIEEAAQSGSGLGDTDPTPAPKPAPPVPATPAPTHPTHP
ncbi:MAG: hypothetical protein NXI07_12065, partial [bacterium]|nr:hypothetical protein [bacterium]